MFFVFYTPAPRLTELPLLHVAGNAGEALYFFREHKNVCREKYFSPRKSFEEKKTAEKRSIDFLVGRKFVPINIFMLFGGAIFFRTL